MDAETIAHDAAIGITVVGKVASGIDHVLPWLMLAGGLVPGADTVLAALQIARPVLERIAAVAPVAVAAINDGEPIIAAIDRAGPQVLADLKDMLAIVTSAKIGVRITRDDVSDADAYAFAGPLMLGRVWTDAETQGWWDRASGQSNF